MEATDHLEEVCDRMSALGNPTRLHIYRHLVRAGPTGLPVAAVQERIEVPASTLSHHLRRMVEVGLVQQERMGTTLICRADYAVMEATFAVFARECCIDNTSDTSNTDTCC